MRVQTLVGFCVCCFATVIVAQEGDKTPKSGPQVGQLLPAPFDCLIINGKNKGRQHCLVCEQGLNPAVLVFAREAGEGKNGPTDALLAKLDSAIERHQERFLGGSVVFLSPAAKNSSNNEKEVDAENLVLEARARDELVKRLASQAEKLKSLTVGCFPSEGPKGYGIDAKAEVTVLIYERHKVLANFAFAEGKWAEADVDRIIAKLDETMKRNAPKD